MKLLKFSLIAIALTIAAALPCRADQSFFMGLGDLPGGDFQSVATDISADGKIVVGYSKVPPPGSNPSQIYSAFRWTQDTGMLNLGSKSGPDVVISADGSTIAGAASGGQFRWTQSSGYTMLPTGGLQGLALHGINGDGSIIVGAGYNGSSIGVAWVNGGAAQQFLPHQVQDISADGSVVIGWGLPSDSVMSEKYVWTAQTGMVQIPHPIGGTFDNIGSISADGKVAVGYGTFAGQARAVRWTAATGVVPLELGPDGFVPVRAYNTSADGTVIVGGALDSTNHPGLAFIWDAVHGTRDLQKLLTDEYGLGSSFVGWDFNNSSRAIGVSADGRTITGFAKNFDGNYEAWIAHLGTVPEPASLLLGLTGVAALATARLYQYRAHLAKETVQ